jgi:hypothetical protein
MPFWIEESLPSLRSVPGGDNLLALFGGQVPRFGDAEIVSLHLNRAGQSTLRVHEFLKSVLVTFTLTEIINLNLDDFSPQNVIGRLDIRLIREFPETFGIEWIRPPPTHSHYEIKLESVYGLGGTIQTRHMTISLSPALKSP